MQLSYQISFLRHRYFDIFTLTVKIISWMLKKKCKLSIFIKSTNVLLTIKPSVPHDNK